MGERGREGVTSLLVHVPAAPAAANPAGFAATGLLPCARACPVCGPTCRQRPILDHIQTYGRRRVRPCALQSLETAQRDLSFLSCLEMVMDLACDERGGRGIAGGV